MNHDVFISYSRKDREQAKALCNALAAAGVEYWIDLSIGGSTNFLTEITRRIKDCNVLIFIASANSATSKFTQKEILYAIKHNKTILPYKIGDFQLEDNDELDFIFTNVQWVESLTAVVSTLNDMGLTNKTTSDVVVPKPQPKPQPEPKPQPQPKPQPTAKTYKVGDLYDDGTKKGVVFEVTPDGKHGKIVSLEEAYKLWAIAAVYRDKTGVTSMTDGKANMQKIMAISSWREKYPAFAWCADLGEGWYLPARDELFAIYQARDKINATLSSYDYTELNRAWHLSSSEHGTYEFCAWSVRMGNGGTGYYNKLDFDYVRAVSAF